MSIKKTIVYSSTGSAFKFKNLLKEIFKDFAKSNSLGFRLAIRNIKAKYRQSLFGILWAFLPPLVTALIWIILKGQGVVDFGDSGVSYPLFVLVGTMLWQIFTQSLLIPLQVMQSNKSILTKINFPREAIFFNAFYEIVFSYILSLIVIITLIFAFHLPFELNVLYFILLSLLLIMMGMAVSLFLIPISSLYSDIQLGMPAMLQLLMYLTPVIYPEPVYKGVAVILDYNPITPVLNGARNLLLGMTNEHSLTFFIGTFFLLLLMIFVGLLLLRVTLTILIERMGT